MNRKNEKAALRVTSTQSSSERERLQRPSRSPFYHNKSQNGGANRENF